MKTNGDEKFSIRGERLKLEALVAQGRQLHDKAVFDVFARMFGFVQISDPASIEDSMHETPGWANPK